MKGSKWVGLAGWTLSWLAYGFLVGIECQNFGGQKGDWWLIFFFFFLISENVFPCNYLGVDH